MFRWEQNMHLNMSNLLKEDTKKKALPDFWEANMQSGQVATVRKRLF